MHLSARSSESLTLEQDRPVEALDAELLSLPGQVERFDGEGVPRIQCDRPFQARYSRCLFPSV